MNGRVQKFAQDGTPMASWGTTGAGSGDLRTPFGIAVSGGRVYVADFGNDRVQIFSTDGTLIGVVGSRGSGDGQFSRPASVAVDQEGGLYVSDHFNDRVQRFNGEGRFQGLLGTVSAAPAAVSAFGNGAVSSGGTLTPAPTGTPTAVPDNQLRRPEGIAIDQDGNLWVADYGRDRVVKLSPDGRLLLVVGTRGSAAGEFLGPKGIAIDPTSGRIYVADTGNARVQRLSVDGIVEAAWPLPLPTTDSAPATTPAPAFAPLPTATPQPTPQPPPPAA
jgi:DNA-binding beta-propeller fold protein YncE